MHVGGGEARQCHGQYIGSLPKACENLSILELDKYSQNLVSESVTDQFSFSYLISD